MTWKRILVVGQTPPPFGGQAVMIQNMLKGTYRDIRLYHVRMRFSREMDEVGIFKIRKVFHLFSLVLRIVLARIVYRTKVLYYPPAGPERIAIVRDVMILLMVRWMFVKTIFHFHASGLSEFLPNLGTVARRLCQWAYSLPDVAVRLSEEVPGDGTFLRARKEVIVPYGIPEIHESSSTKDPQANAIPRILFVGVVRESKGVFDLMEASSMLLQNGSTFEVDVIGKIESAGVKERIDQLLEKRGLRPVVHFEGIKVGGEKHQYYSRADIFCFPTFFESEAFPVVLLEAMQHGLPILSTRWRGIPSIVKEGVNGYLVPVHDVKALSARMADLLGNAPLRRQMGENSKKMFNNRYTLAKFHNRMQAVFEEV